MEIRDVVLAQRIFGATSPHVFEAAEFFRSFEVAGIDDPDGDENEVFEVVRHEANCVEQRVYAEPAIAADENYGRMLFGIGLSRRGRLA